jgi:D-alanyl-D-alanine carboxypeptidase/D-alanyl-D-alanine-endopeptidase (penicillin-binding protein 4)
MMRIPSGHQAGILLCICVGLVAVGPVEARELPPVVADALKRAAIPENAVALSVQEVNGGKPLAAFNQNVPFGPASTMKLVTTSAALELLGPSFTWKTQAFASGTQSGDLLQGDLILRGSGDPKLVLENFWLFLRQIRARGIREIRGNLVLDRSAFSENVYDPTKFDGEALKPYNAGPDALLLNFQAFRFRFIVNQPGGPVQVAVDPPAAGYLVVGPKSSNEECGDWKEKLRARFDGSGAQFSGSFSTQCGEKTWYVHPHQMTHTQYFNSVFRQMWADLGGSLKGEVSAGATPAGARLVAEWESVSLPEVIRDINKFSNNVMARQLLLTLAADNPKIPASPERGAQAIKTWLAGKGIEASELVIENGSGLSRTERISAATMGQVLVAAFQSPLMPEFMSSMPIAGYDGTMRNRLKARSAAGHAHIKTGRLDDVAAIAGYVLAASGKRYAVVCFINHRNAARGQEAQDALLQWVHERG